MYVWVAGFLSVWLCAACGGPGEQFVEVGEGPDEGMAPMDRDEPARERGCERVELDGDFVVERERDFTARFRMGEPYTKTVMLFGGEPVEDANVFSNAYIFGLDKQDALMLAEKYADFYNCSSPGGQAAAEYVIPYDLVPASCEVYDQIVAALRQYDKNVASGGDRTSLRFEGAPLVVESVIETATGDDRTDEVADQNFHLVTSVQQLTGQSVLSFGTSDE
jgi:hypothetical protein